MSFLADTHALLAQCLALSALLECVSSIPQVKTVAFVPKPEVSYFQDETGNTLEI